MTDMLIQLFAKQEELQGALGYDFSNMSDKERVAYIMEYHYHCEHELHEMIKELPFFKSWKRYSEGGNASMFIAGQKEFIDALHFFINMALALGFTPEMLFEMYAEKHGINHERQENTAEYKRCTDET